jgi:transposase, IS6 family
MPNLALLNWRPFEADIILGAVRWYLRSALRYRDVAERLRERGVWGDHTTVYRGVQRSAPALDKRCRPSLRATHASSRVDATDIKRKQQGHDLDRAVDSTGATLDFMLSATRDADAAERFCRPVLQASHTLTPRVITGEKHAASPGACDALQPDGTLPEPCRLRPCTDRHHRIAQDHRLIKRRVSPG